MYDAKFEKEFETKRKQYEAAIREHVCAHCVDLGDDRVCHKTGGVEECAIIVNLKDILYIAKAVDAKKIDPYVKELRERVCSHCEKSKPDQSCERRELIECCVDRYLPLVLEAIEDVDRG